MLSLSTRAALSVAVCLSVSPPLSYSYEREIFRSREARTVRERAELGTDGAVHVGGVERREQQSVDGEEETRAQTNALKARPRLSSRASFSFASKTIPSTVQGYGPQRRHATRPKTAPEPGSRNQRTPGSNDGESISEQLTGASVVPEVARRCFSPRAPRGFYDSRSNNGHVWIDRRSPRNRRQDKATSTGVAGHRWVGCAETRWKAMQLHVPGPDTMPSARSPVNFTEAA